MTQQGWAGAINQNRASKYIKCEIAAILKRSKSVFVLCCTQGKTS